MPAPEHHIQPALLDGKPLDLSQMAVLGCEVQLGSADGQPPRCHICGAPATWNAAVRLDLVGHTVGYALLFHCLAHRPTPTPVIVAGRTLECMVPPPSSNWAVVNGEPEPSGAPGWPRLPGPPRLG